MRRLLLYTSLILLISTAATSFGWYLACNKPCDPEYIMVKGDTVYMNVEPEIAVKATEEGVKKPTVWQRVKGTETIHKVKEGETVYGIATRLYHIPVPTLMAWNNLTSPAIKRGQKLYIGTPQQRDSARTSDSLYTYQKEFGDSTVKGTVYTQSPCKIISQSVVWESLAKPPKNRIFCGFQIDNLRNLSGMGALELKSGWMVTGSVGVFGDKSYQVGVMKRLR